MHYTIQYNYLTNICTIRHSIPHDINTQEDIYAFKEVQAAENITLQH